MLDPSFPYQEITYKIIGCAMEVHRRTQRGYREKYYQRALDQEMLKAGLVTEMEHHKEIYDGQTWLGRLYLDHWVNECIVVEDKAVSHTITEKDEAQVISYLAAMEAKVRIFLNFGRQRLEYRRILRPKSTEGWRTHIQPYLWRPDKDQTNPIEFKTPPATDR